MVNKNDHITNVTNLNPIIFIYIYKRKRKNIAINLVLQFFSHDYRHPKGSGSR